MITEQLHLITSTYMFIPIFRSSLERYFEYYGMDLINIEINIFYNKVSNIMTNKNLLKQLMTK